MASFTQVRYGSQFKPITSPKQTSNPYGGYVNSPGAGKYSLASLIGNKNPSVSPPSTTPAVSPAVTPAAGAAPSDAAVSATKAGTKFNPPTPDSLATDPILMQIRDLGKQRVSDARTGALTSAEQALIGYGSYDVPQTLKDLYAKDTENPIYAALNDQGARSAAEANPDSTLRLLAGEHARNDAGIDQSTNAQNLYYSSTHANQLGDEATGYRQRQNQAQQSLASLLGQANQGVTDTETQALDQYQGALPDAYQRALDLATLLGGDPTAGGGDGSGGAGGGGTGGGFTVAPGASAGVPAFVANAPGILDVTAPIAPFATGGGPGNVTASGQITAGGSAPNIFGNPDTPFKPELGGFSVAPHTSQPAPELSLADLLARAAATRRGQMY